MPNQAEPKPFRINVPDAVLADLQERLARVRWPDEIPDSGWTHGTNLAYMKSLAEYWREKYAWREQEAKLNRLPQYTVPLEGLDLHFVHQPGQGPRPMPLLISHGWPGSIVEFSRLIPMLADPAAFGGDPADSFSVVAPSLPGYAFSYRPNQERLGIRRIAALFARLMSQVLGYEKFAAQGGDWGALVTATLASQNPELLHGIHLNLLPLPIRPGDLPNPDPEQRRYLKDLARWNRDETAYQRIQGTKPQTLSFGLSDSPVGLAAWIVEKFHTWSDCRGDLDGWLGRDPILSDIMLYWCTGAINSSFWPYWTRRHHPWPLPTDRPLDVPTGYVEFPKEIVRPPQSLARRFFNIQRWQVEQRGGHFAAMERPEVLAREIRAFFRPFRQARG